MVQHLDRFSTGAELYAAYRPAYPNALMLHLGTAIARVDAPTSHDVMDVGAGTGIFTRQLSAVLGQQFRIFAVEPSDDMRSHGLDAGLHSAAISWLKGTAEALPATDSSLRAVVVATAAHWFDRPQFYEECRRTLVPGGIMAIAEYLRDIEASPAAAALEKYLRENGGPKEARPDYRAEFASLTGFGKMDEMREAVTLHLSPAQYVGLALSSSYCKPIVEKLGPDRVEHDLAALAESHSTAADSIPYGYLFRLYLTSKT